MRDLLSTFASEIQSNRSRLFVRRAMWLDLEERVRKTLAPVLASPNAEAFGGLVVRNIAEMNAERLKEYQVTRMQLTNAIYLFTATSRPDVLKTFGKDAFTWVTEHGAALWFAQGAAGGVSVFMSPYQSELHRHARQVLWVSHYDSPHQLSEARIRKHLKRFLTHCVLSSYTSPPSWRHLVHFRWLQFVDRRYRAHALRGVAGVAASLAKATAAAAARFIAGLPPSPK